MTTILTNTNQEVENLETFYLIWLGESINIEFQQQLRTIINYLLIFDDKQQCFQYIQSLSKDDRIILVIHGKLHQQIIPEIIHLPQIITIYIYCRNKKLNEQLTKNSKKIKRVINHRNELIQQIHTDYNQLQLYNFDEPLSISYFNSKAINGKLLSANFNNNFIHLQILIDCLSHMESSLNDKNDLIILCKQQYKNNPNELNIIEEFEKYYLSERSLYWYTRNSFLSRLLNKAIRINNIDLLLYFRFFIHDIKRELIKNKCLSSIRVYRAQLMFKEEMEVLKKFIGEFISINNFFSTSPNREQTRSYLSSSILSDDMERILFEIDVNPQSNDIKYFSNITSFSYYPDREEILFMIGSIFRIVHIDQDINGIWNIQLILSSNKEHQLQAFIQNKKIQLDIIETDFLSFGFILEDMNKLDDAEKYYHRILNQLSKDNEDLNRLYHALGEVTQKKGDYESSLKWYNKSLEIDTETLKIDDPNIALSHNSIAVVYSKKSDYIHALESYEKALEIWKKLYGEDHLDVAMCYNNMGIIYQEQMKYSQALEFYHKAWNIRQKYLPIEHPSFGQIHVCIGNVHYHLNHYDLALEHYKLSLETFKNSPLPYYPEIAMIVRNIGFVYRDKGEFQQALSYMGRAATIYRYSLPVTHPDVIQIEEIIRQISSKL